MRDKLPLDWWEREELWDVGLATCDQAWIRDREMFDDFAEVTRQQLASGVEPAVARTQWTQGLLRRNYDAGPDGFAWMMAGLILRLAQSIQIPELDLEEDV